VFFRTIILPGLESNTSSLQQKLITIRDLYTICKSPQALVDLFVNYDCDPAGKDIYEEYAFVTVVCW
jgi:brefeldin A-inhibited guanine nucleotide-exchange protein